MSTQINVPTSGHKSGGPQKNKIAADTTEHHLNVPFRFLDLPPELRNMVYGYYLHPGARVSFYSQRRWTHRSSWARRRPGYGSRALTLVNRQITSEFRPIYNMNVEVEISYALLPKYLSAYFKTREECKMGPRTIIVCLGKVREDNEDLPACKSVDILPLLWMKDQIPEFQCTFRDGSTAWHRPWRTTRTRESCTAKELDWLLADGYQQVWPNEEERTRFYELRVTRFAVENGKRNQWLDIEARAVNPGYPYLDPDPMVKLRNWRTNTRYLQKFTSPEEEDTQA
ncbi:hypothetical protein K491DRAFT_735304 [Lophiostoma macrostomum CBS 122681]|uniref:F-box domain-containing protein n=1 Tax=Lophiostoma macrostomum CBS 122681 TaxID=1314788 RepID=A0A6A6SS91_9PLEO|nr:hypothetical protein K491DRAFT_735304 [Lophiostoma macrostomum CBS 122681]